MLNSNSCEAPVLPQAAESEFCRAVLAGLSRRQKSLPCRFLYDARGSALFEAITDLPEYYPTRTEMAILKSNVGTMVQEVPPGAVLVEFGSGSSRKTEVLLSKLRHLRAYVMIDVSASALADAQQRLARRYPGLDVRTIQADFTLPFALPADLHAAQKVGFFPGSTIGNLMPTEAQRLLRLFRAILSPHGRLIVGVDLKKDANVLIPAYNDGAGVTAAFNLNLLDRINREIEPCFDLRNFRHEAIYNSRDGRVEMHLVSLVPQEIRIRGTSFFFEEGESIHTENSYKYSISQFRYLAGSAGWRLQETWMDKREYFSVHELLSA